MPANERNTMTGNPILPNYCSQRLRSRMGANVPGWTTPLRALIAARILIVLLAALFIPSLADAQTATQTINLQEGWNAVWLEVEPTYAADHPTQPGLPMSPEDAFNTAGNAAIKVIASPRQLAGLAEFFSGSTTANADTIGQGTINQFNQQGWETWHRGSPVNENNLVMTTGNRPYLIKATPAVTLNVTGTVRFFRPTWAPDRYNLVGFGITGTVSFQDFFGPSNGTHPVEKIYTLAPGGDWSVVGPGNPMEDDRAYWIFCNGASDYMGPVAVDFDGALTGRLNFGGPADAVKVGTGVPALQLDLEEIVLTNLNPTNGRAATPMLKLRRISPGSRAGDLQLHVVNPVANSFAYERGNQVDSTPGDGVASELGETVAPRSTAVLTMGARRNWTSGAVDRTFLYRLKTGAGSEFWLPVTALNNSIQVPGNLLPESDAGKVAGLWVGEISIDAVTSIVEDGAPTRPAAGRAPVRILLHSDATGAVTLLSQVTVMQTRTADAGVESQPVLVVNPAGIPFFEGIKERNGKRVGLRLEAVAYDMPRKLDATSQDRLLNDAAYPGLTAGGIADFLVGRASRPPSLVEVYHFSWPMDGAIGGGKTVRTAPDRPLNLDPFHRSNPFRHAYHHAHPKGPSIDRSMTIGFDSEQSPDGRLRGTYTETVQGLIQSDLKLTGTIQLQRVSPVANLEQ